MAVQQQQVPKVRYVDLPQVAETFADSVHTVIWDAHALRIELCITRFSELTPPANTEATRHPACRLVLTPAAAADLFNRLQQTMAALAKAGVVTQQKTPPPAPASA